jgi:heme exporter protein D
VTGPEFRADRVYLGWQHALPHPDPGPPPRRPVPPVPQQLSPGWLEAQRREEDRLARPAKLTAGGSLVLLAAAAGLAAAGLLAAPLTAAVATGLAGLAGLALRSVWQGERVLRAAVAAEERRVAAARAAQESRLFARQEEHARRFRDWQERRDAFTRQRQWYGVALPVDIDRVDVAGGTQAGWSAMLTTIAAPRLAAGGEVTVLDLAESTIAADLLALARASGIAPLVWVLPGDLPRLDLGTGLPRAALADVLALAASAAPGQDTPPDLAHDTAILDRLLGVLGDGAGIAEVTAGLRALAQVGDPREDVGRGLLTAAQIERIAALYGREAAGRVVTERAWALEARLRKLAPLGCAPPVLPASPLRVLALDRAAGMTETPVLGTYITVALTHLLRQAPPGRPWRHTLCVTGAERLRGDVLDRLCHACEATRTGLVLAYRTLGGPVKERLGRGNAAVAFMRLGNADDAKAASEQLGMEHRFLISQLTETVGTSVTLTAGDSYTSTVSGSGSAGVSAADSRTTGHSRGRGHSHAGISPFGQHTASGSRDTSSSRSTTDSGTWTESITTSTSWGVNTSRALGENESLARTSQRSREFLVEPHELQQLPASAAIVSYAARDGRQVVLADLNPAILALPTATVAGLAGEPAAGPGAATAAQPPAPQPGPGGTPAAGTAAPAMPAGWRSGDGQQPPANLGPPPAPLDWRRPPG